jgi:hypothetical protein
MSVVYLRDKSEAVINDAPLSNIDWFRHAKARMNQWQAAVDHSPANGSNRRMVALWQHQVTLTYTRMTQQERNYLKGEQS